MAEAARTANLAQVRRWNGEGGQFWILHRERHLAGHQSLLPHLFGAAAISPGARVLDVGCGCGETTITAARAGGGAIGLDLSGPMLEVARRLAAQAGVENARFVRGDAQICPLRPGSRSGQGSDSGGDTWLQCGRDRGGLASRLVGINPH